MTQLLNLVLTLGIPLAGLLIAYRVWSHATASGNKSPMKVVMSLVTTAIVFGAGVLFIPKALNWGSNVFMSQMMANPGVQSGIQLLGTGAGIVDAGLSAPAAPAAPAAAQVPTFNQLFGNIAAPAAAAPAAAPQITLPTFGNAAPAAPVAPVVVAPPASMDALIQSSLEQGQAAAAQIAAPAAAAVNTNQLNADIARAAANATAQAVFMGPWKDPNVAVVPAGTEIEIFTGPYADVSEAIQVTVVAPVAPQAAVPSSQDALIWAPTPAPAAPVAVVQPTPYVAPPTAVPVTEAFVGPYANPNEAVVQYGDVNAPVQVAGDVIVNDEFVGPWANPNQAVKRTLVHKNGALVWVETGQ